MIIKKLTDIIVALLLMIFPGRTATLNLAGLRIETPAAVFESGDDMYTVIWTTNHNANGYVTYTYEGVEYTVTDQIGGNIRSVDTVHAVRVPKAHLDGNEYSYHSQRVLYKGGYEAIKGRTVDSDPVSFKGYSGEEEINALILSDIHCDPDSAKAAADYFDVEPSFIIMNGDLVDHIITKAEFINILSYSALFSGGEIPVVYARGNHEPRGQYASEMLQYFRTSTGGLYYTFNYGPVWGLVLDAGEDKEDSHDEYSGLVDFRAYIADESKWLSTVTPTDSQYKLCIVHKPKLNDLDGSTWIDVLAEMEIDAVLSGHSHRLDLHYCEGEQPYYRMITGGKNTDSGYIATMMTLKDSNMHMKSIDLNGNILADEDFVLK